MSGHLAQSRRTDRQTDSGQLSPRQGLCQGFPAPPGTILSLGHPRGLQHGSEEQQERGAGRWGEWGRAGAGGARSPQPSRGSGAVPAPVPGHPAEPAARPRLILPRAHPRDGAGAGGCRGTETPGPGLCGVWPAAPRAAPCPRAAGGVGGGPPGPWRWHRVWACTRSSAVIHPLDPVVLRSPSGGRRIFLVAASEVAVSREPRRPREPCPGWLRRAGGSGPRSIPRRLPWPGERARAPRPPALQARLCRGLTGPHGAAR